MSNSDQKPKFSKINNKSSNWNLPNVAFMVGGFVVAFPVGIATAAWLALGKDVNIARTLKNTYDQYSPTAKDKFDDIKNKFGTKFNGNNPDNAAYQAYRAQKAAEYEATAQRAAEEAKTEEEQFNEYMAWQKQAKDEANFADFQKHQKTQTTKDDSE